MITTREQQTAQESGFTFKEWTSLFSGESFLKAAIVYADESGTHDKTGKEKGSENPIVAGIAAPPSVWADSCVEWKAVLNAYGVDYFHSRELRAAKAAMEHKKPATPELRKNPYYGWDLRHFDKFLMALARIVSKGNKVLIAGCLNIPAFNALKTTLETKHPEQPQLYENPYMYVIREFFTIYQRETRIRWGKFKCPVSFFFDQSDNEEWRLTVQALFYTFQKKDSRMKELAFVNKKDALHLPLQAADMLAYRMRQLTQILWDNPDGFEFSKTDKVFLKTLLKSAAVANPQLAPLIDSRRARLKRELKVTKAY